jgi:hypothetical protein
MGKGVRKSLRTDEMDGSISQPEISGFKDNAVCGGRKNTSLSDIFVDLNECTHSFGPLKH